VTFSEKIVPVHKQGTPWDSLLFFMSFGADKDSAHRLVSLREPVVLNEEGTQWMFIVTNDLREFKPNVNDYVFMSPSAPYSDTAPAKNGPSDRENIIVGLESKGSINNAYVFIPVEGLHQADPNMLLVNGVFDAFHPGQVAPANSRIYWDKDGNQKFVYEWIPPAGLNGQGTLDPDPADCHENAAEVRGLAPYPSNCLSTIRVNSKDKYIAKISIFDHLGKFVQSLEQRFGYCGELENPRRETPQGLASWLVWNQKDRNGRYVGSGVYIWKVEFITPDDRFMELYRQGIARSVEPEEGCATNGQ
jgi:hypothetical protein